MTHCATQMPHAMRTIIAELIGMPESELRVIAPDVGGGFGQKMSLAPSSGSLVRLPSIETGPSRNCAQGCPALPAHHFIIASSLATRWLS